jgi:hypothetical protein
LDVKVFVFRDRSSTLVPKFNVFQRHYSNSFSNVGQGAQ